MMTRLPSMQIQVAGVASAQDISKFAIRGGISVRRMMLVTMVKEPMLKMIMSPSFCIRGTCSFVSIGIGKN